MEQSGLQVVRRKGKVAELVHTVSHFDLAGTCGIGHTRWATHGRPSEANAHPHTSCAGDIAVVHNGNIENFAELREELQENGHVFRSETDTEVIAHLVEDELEGSPSAVKEDAGDLLAAVRRASERLVGSYGLAVMSQREPGTIIVTRKDSPIIVGRGSDGSYVASDAIAVLQATRDVVVLADRQFARLTPQAIQYFNANGDAIAREGALKLKEISYLHAEAYAAGEMKHGPIALIDEGFLVIAIATQSPVYDKVISNLQESCARGALVVAIATEGDTEIQKHADHVIYIPKVRDALSAITASLPLQLLARSIAVKRGCDVDQPRNLAKSVTVE